MNLVPLLAGKEQEAQKLIDSSGNGFQYRVIDRLRELGWKVLVSPYYNDNITDKPREIDIIAEKEYEVKSIMSAWLGTVTVRLFLECKYVNKNVAFWFDEKDRYRVGERVVADTRFKRPGHNHEIDHHHYFEGDIVAKLFTTQGVGEDGDPIYKAVNQGINAMLYYRHRQGIFPQPEDKVSRELHSISYPVIIVNSFDNFFAKNAALKADPAIFSIEGPFQLEVNYAYLDQKRNSQNEYFLIDVVSIDQLEDFISKIEKSDITPIIQNLSFTQDPGRRWQRDE